MSLELKTFLTFSFLFNLTVLGADFFTPTVIDDEVYDLDYRQFLNKFNKQNYGEARPIYHNSNTQASTLILLLGQTEVLNFEAHQGGTNFANFNKNGKKLVTAGQHDNKVKVWYIDRSNKRSWSLILQHIIDNPAPEKNIYAAAFDDDESIIIINYVDNFNKSSYKRWRLPIRSNL